MTTKQLECRYERRGFGEGEGLLFFRIKAASDENGNPRRCFIVLEKGDGTVIAVKDEGYTGRQAVLNIWGKAAEGPDVKTTVDEYVSYIDFGSELDDKWDHKKAQFEEACGYLMDMIKAGDVVLKGPGYFPDTRRWIVSMQNLATAFKMLYWHLNDGKEEPDWKIMCEAHQMLEEMTDTEAERMEIDKRRRR